MLHRRTRSAAALRWFPPALTERRWPVGPVPARARRSQNAQPWLPSRQPSVTGQRRPVKAEPLRGGCPICLSAPSQLRPQQSHYFHFLVHAFFHDCGLDKGTIILFDFGEYNSCVASLMVAVAEKNTGKCIRLLQGMLSAMLTPRDMSSSPLFCRIAKASNLKQMLPTVLHELENSSAYGFLQNCDEFKALISRYKALAGI